jgi:hypothetical protein
LAFGAQLSTQPFLPHGSVSDNPSNAFGKASHMHVKMPEARASGSFLSERQGDKGKESLLRIEKIEDGYTPATGGRSGRWPLFVM